MNLSENFKLRLGTILTILGCIGVTLMAFYNFRGISKRAQNFYTHKVVGKISSINMPNSGIELKIENDNNGYAFFQEQQSYERLDFYKTVQIGDSIFKKAYSDTIFVKRDTVTNTYVIHIPK